MRLLVDLYFLLNLTFGPLKNIYFYVSCHLNRVIPILRYHFLADVVLVEPKLLTCSFKWTLRFRLQFRKNILNSHLFPFLYSLSLPNSTSSLSCTTGCSRQQPQWIVLVATSVILLPSFDCSIRGCKLRASPRALKFSLTERLACQCFLIPSGRWA